MGVRWDAVVTDSRFWSDPGDEAPAAKAAGADASVLLDVLLFGSLADATTERPLRLEFQRPFAVDDVIAALGRRCGPALLSRITSPDGGSLRHCRVYVNGEEIEDTRAPVRISDTCAQVEMIMLTAAEGG